MKPRGMAVVALLVWAVVGTVPAPAPAAAPPCGEAVELGGAHMECEAPISRGEARQRMHGTPGEPPEHQYQLVGQCASALDSYPECNLYPCPPDQGGFYHSLQESPLEATPSQWTHIAYVCVNSATELFGPSDEDILRAFKRLSWPAATLVVEPADGETLVNYPTAFHTPDDQPVTQTITLLGQSVVIEATPVQWTWHWAQPTDDAPTADTTPHTTTHPGAPDPHATITHAYRTGALTVHPSVDVTYQGRYRLNNGPWQEIPEDHTVPGTPSQPITVLEARPTLVR